MKRLILAALLQVAVSQGSVVKHFAVLQVNPSFTATQQAETVNQVNMQGALVVHLECLDGKTWQPCKNVPYGKKFRGKLSNGETFEMEAR